jgi:predicted membrane protein
MRRKLPSLFALLAFLTMAINGGLYVFDIYTDVILVKFLYLNDYLFAVVLSLIFIVNHYFIVAGLLSYQLWFYIKDSLKRDLDRELLRQEMDEAGDLKAIEELKLKSNWFIRAMNNGFVYWTVMVGASLPHFTVPQITLSLIANAAHCDILCLLHHRHRCPIH